MTLEAQCDELAVKRWVQEDNVVVFRGMVVNKNKQMSRT
jgi:hypothetical protein